LVYFDHNRGRGTWVIRDFIAGQRLDDNHSALTVADRSGRDVRRISGLVQYRGEASRLANIPHTPDDRGIEAQRSTPFD